MVIINIIMSSTCYVYVISVILFNQANTRGWDGLFTKVTDFQVAPQADAKNASLQVRTYL